MHLIDSHAHLDFYNDHPAERDEILQRSFAASVKTILAIGIGEGPDQMHKALDLANSVDGENSAPQDTASFRQWAAEDFDTWQDRVKGRNAAVEVLLPMAAIAIGMTAFAIILHFTAVGT